MDYTLIVHRTLLHPRIREMLAAYEGEKGGFLYSSPIGFVQFTASGDPVLGKTMSHTPYPKGLVLKAELVCKAGSSSFQMLKFRYPDWKVCSTNLADAPNINWDAFKEWSLRHLGMQEENRGDPTWNMAFAKLFAWYPEHPDTVNEECKSLGFKDLNAMSEQLAHLVTNGAYPAGEKCSVPTRNDIDDFDDFLLGEDGKSVSFAILKSFQAKHDFWMSLTGKNVLQIGGSIYLIEFVAKRQQYEFTLMDEERIIYV